MQGPSEFTSSSTHNVDIESGLLGHEVSNLGGRVWKQAIFTTMFVILMLMLILITCYGVKPTTKTTYTKTSGCEDRCIALLFGIATVIFGLIYFIVGLTIVADVALDLLDWLRQEDRSSENEDKEQMTNCEIFVNTLAVMLSMFMLICTIYYGYKLAVEAQEVVIYSRLPFLIGVISMSFGFIYFIIAYGMGILAESAFRLSSRLHQAVAKSDTLLDRHTHTEVNKV